MEKTIEKKIKKEKKPIEYFTDEMHKNLFVFQEGLPKKMGTSGKPAMLPVKLSMRRK